MDFELINPKEHKQLFLDNHVIESMKGVKKSLHQPQKWGPVIKSGYQSRISPQWNTDKEDLGVVVYGREHTLYYIH